MWFFVFFVNVWAAGTGVSPSMAGGMGAVPATTAGNSAETTLDAGVEDGPTTEEEKVILHMAESQEAAAKHKQWIESTQHMGTGYDTK